MMSGLWLHFAAGALALSSLCWLLFRPASLVLENGYSSTKPHMLTLHLPDNQRVAVALNAGKSPKVHTDWIGLGHMSTWEPVMLWLGVG